ncbi:MAG: hypothetical protein ACYC1I_12375 [Acidimicrobiales bacterium]
MNEGSQDLATFESDTFTQGRSGMGMTSIVQSEMTGVVLAISDASLNGALDQHDGDDSTRASPEPSGQ